MLWDAHTHLHAAALRPYEGAMMEELRRQGIVGGVINGTEEEDWPQVAEFCARHPGFKPAFGLHPWYVARRSSRWRERLGGWLERIPQASVGECGLDRWVQGHEVAVKAEVFRAHLALATERERPVTIHCLRAWGLLLDILRAGPRPAAGFLLHAYGGPAEMVRELVKLGGYFSFSGYFLHARKAAARGVFATTVPTERLLVETDAPDMALPAEHQRWQFAAAEGVNHPANLQVTYAALGQLRGVDAATLQEQVAANWRRLFGGGSTERR